MEKLKFTIEYLEEEHREILRFCNKMEEKCLEILKGEVDVEFFTNASKMNVYTKTPTIISLILISMMLPLMITSFKCVRKKMKAKNWKNLQKLAYPFFYLIYVHLMILFMIKPEKHILSIVLYTVIYMLYTILRVRKYFVTKNKQK